LGLDSPRRLPLGEVAKSFSEAGRKAAHTAGSSIGNGCGSTSPPWPAHRGLDARHQRLDVAALESGKEFHDIFGSPAVKFSPTNHLASAETMVQQIQNGRWKVIQTGLMF
jgi:hypothetical protein